MKKFRLLKSVAAGWGCAGVLEVLALTAPASALPAFGNLPLYFTAASPNPLNQPAQFVARGGDYQFLISPAEVQLNLQKSDVPKQKISSRSVQMQFVGADAQAQIRGTDELPGKINYLVGNNPAQWRTGIATFARLRAEQLYPGISLAYYGNQRQLEYDFTVAPGANPKAIEIRFEGVDKISVGAQGELILTVGKGEIRQPPPVIYQTVNGARKAVGGGYQLLDSHTVAFAVGEYNHKLPLVIDPVLNFSTYFGGNSSDTAWSIALDTNGFIYVAGNTLSSKFPANSQPNGFQTNFAGGSTTGDAFVAKFDNQGSNLFYLTYLGGSADDAAYGITVDTNGDAYITGITSSKNFPVKNAIFTNLSGTLITADAFIAELDPSGSKLVYSTYLGGNNLDAAFGIAVDLSGNAYVTGVTYSTNFPTTNAYQKTFQATNWAYQAYYNGNAFVTEIAAGGSNLLYSSYFGGTNLDIGRGITVDSSNNVYVTGLTASTNFPTLRAITNLFNGYLLNGSTNTTPGFDAFVAKFAPGCTSLIYSTFLGGNNNDAANSIAVDGLGNAYVTGWTVSTNFPNTATSVAGLYNGLTNSAYSPYITNAFLTQITQNGTNNAAIGYSAVFGGTNGGFDIGQGVALDYPYNDAFVVGSSSSTSFPITNTPGLLGNTNAGGSDAFVIAFNTNCSAILYSGYLGGSGNDYGYSVAVDSSTNIYIVGQTASANFPVLNARQSTLNGSSDAFLAKIGSVNEPPQITLQPPTNQVVAVGTTVSFVTAETGTPPLTFLWQKGGTNLVWTNLVNRGNIGGVNTATLTITNAQETNSGYYQLIVSNTAGWTNSLAALLTVTNGPPTITTQPTNQLVEKGEPVTLVVTAIGPPPLLYQWQLNGTNLVNGTNISGATNATLNIKAAQTNDSGNYQVIVSNLVGSVTSSVAVLTVAAAPLITTQPTNQTVVAGTNVIFVVLGPAYAPPYYLQWLKDGMDLTNGTNISGSIISGANSGGLSITNVQTNDAGNYWVIITNAGGAITSSVATLTVVSFPIIQVAPTNQIVGPGCTVVFVVTAIGGIPLSYQWQANGTNLLNGGNISSGVNNPVLTITNVQPSDGGGYSVIVTNSFGSVTSSPPAVLTVIPVPTFLGITAGANGSFIFNGTGGTNGSNYIVLASTNLALSLSQWTTISVNGNQFGSQGQFIFTNTPPADVPQRFYILELPPP